LVRYSGRGRTDTVFRLKNRHNQTSLINGRINLKIKSEKTITKKFLGDRRDLDININIDFLIKKFLEHKIYNSAVFSNQRKKILKKGKKQLPNN